MRWFEQSGMRRAYPCRVGRASRAAQLNWFQHTKKVGRPNALYCGGEVSYKDVRGARFIGQHQSSPTDTTSCQSRSCLRVTTL
mmetsp:Transcript_55844/g.154640  ORF Transcript_55844/g.154640 Transcript_55844/m.154640 type:complete len:83 (+) Transcript_55844:177-425(+)